MKLPATVIKACKKELQHISHCIDKAIDNDNMTGDSTTGKYCDSYCELYNFLDSHSVDLYEFKKELKNGNP